jgi:hypothetical protein
MYSSFSAGKVSEGMRGNRRKSKDEKSKGEGILARALLERSNESPNMPQL